MSDSDFGAVACRLRNVGTNDEIWVKDSLSDDEIDVPKDMVFALNEEDEDEEEESGAIFNANEIWGDLGLDGFLQELASLNSAPLQLQPLNFPKSPGQGNGTAAAATGGGASGGGAPAAGQVGSVGAASPRGI
jgi:hypothetical protein